MGLILVSLAVSIAVATFIENDFGSETARSHIYHATWFELLFLLGIINLLPIPVLDGWHLLIFLLEAVIGRPVSLKIRERAQQIGVFIIIFIMLLVFYNDITRIIGAE